MQAIVGDTSVVIDPTTGTTRPIQGNLLGIANLNDQTITTTTATTQTYSFNLQPSELNTIASRSLLVSVEGAGTSQINGIAPVYTRGNYQIFAVDKAGINLLDISNPLLQATNYNFRVIGDVNTDGKVDGTDSQLLTNAFNQPFDARYDLNRDGTINALDLQLLGGNYGFIAASPAPTTNRPTKIGTILTNPAGITLSEGTGLLTQMTTAIAIDKTPGKKQVISFDLNPRFDLTDRTSIVEDQFAVYLIDPITRRTILDRGEQGTSLFTLTGKTAEYAKGLVTYDGQKVNIDLGNLTNINNAELVFQLINNDTDTTGTIGIQNLTDTLSATPAATLIGAPPTRVAPGAAIANLATYSATTAPKLLLTNVRIDSNTGKYTADLQIENTATTPLPRQLAVLFPNLPAGVTLTTKSGTTSDGTPYINLRDTMNVGGLAPNETNTAISISFDDINLIRLALQPTFLAGAQDIAPTFQPLGTINLTPGQVFSIPLIATDPNGAPITITIAPNGTLPTGTLTGDNTLIFTPTPTQLGTYTFTLVAKQGLLTTSQTVTLNVIPDTVTTTRISGKVNRDKLTAFGGATVDIGGIQTTTNADGSFLITLPTNTATTLKINGITQQLSQLLGHQLYSGVNNQIGSTIYIPTIDTSGSLTSGNTVTNSNLPKVTLTLANTLPPTPYTPIALGKISSTLIPEELFATGTPKSLIAVSTTSTLTTPAKLTLGNDFSVDPGTMMDLWQIDPNTGIPTIVGVGKVNIDGTLIETISGGVAGAGWYYYVPTPIAQQSPDDNAYNPISTLDVAPMTVPINSEANLYSGEVTDSYQLLGYQSLGVNRVWQLNYSSERANSEQTINFEYKAFAGSRNNGLFAKLTLRTDDFVDATAVQQWQLAAPPTSTPVQSALKIDTSTLKSGIYRYDLATGLNNIGDPVAQSLNRTRGQLIHVDIRSPFGAGWGLAGLQQVVINNENSLSESLLLIDGNGTEQQFTIVNRSGGVSEYGSATGTPSEFKRLADRTFERRLIDGTFYKFDDKGFLTSEKDRNGNETRFEYVSSSSDPDNKIINKIIDPVGLVTTFINNGAKVTAITNPAGRTTILDYDGNNNLAKITDPDSSESRWEYTPNHLANKSIDKLGREGRDYYDSFGKVTSAVRKDGSTVSFLSGRTSQLGYVLSTNNPSSVSIIPFDTTDSTPTIRSINGNGFVTRTTFNRFGQAEIITDDIGTKTNVYNRRGSLIQTIDENLNKISYSYNSKNQVTEITYGDRPSVYDPPLFNDPSTKYPTTANINHIVSTNDGRLVTSDNRGNIITENINTSGVLSVNRNISLRNVLQLNTVDKLTVKKLLVGDFNNDGIDDLAVGYSKEVFNAPINTDFTAFTPENFFLSFTNTPVYTNEAGIVILTGDGAGDFTFRSKKVINSTVNRDDNYQFEIADLAAGYFDGDSTLDIVAANAIDPAAVNWRGANNYQLYLLKNDGAGNLRSVDGNDRTNRALKPFTSVDSKNLLATGKGSGGQDILIVASSPNSEQTIIRTYSSDGDGKFTEAALNYTISGVANDIKAVDLNTDGISEVVVNSDRLYVIDLLSPNTITNPIRSLYTTQNTGFRSYLSVVDVDGDNIKDAIVANDNSTLKVFLGNNSSGITRFDTLPQIYQGTSSPRGLIVKDLNNDSKPDIIIGDAFAGFDVKFHSPPPASVAINLLPHQTFTYDNTFGQLTESIDELGRRTIYGIDATNGNRLSETRVVGALGGTDDLVTTYSYNSRGQMLTMRDAKGYLTTFDYSGSPIGQLSSMTNAAGDATTYSYDAAGNRTAIIDAEGHRTEYVFDNMNRVRELIGAKPDPASSYPRTYYDYYLNGQIKKMTDPNGNTTDYYYDGLSRLDRTIDGEGNITRSGYDLAGNLDYTIDGRGNRTDYRYDARNRLVTVINADSTLKRTTYNPTNTVESITDENGNKIQKNYDSRNRLIEEIDAKNQSTTYTLDDASQITKVKNARNQTTSYTYDDLGRKTSTITPLDGTITATTTTEYDKNSNITATIDAENRRTEFGYDNLNRQIQTKDALNKITTYGYDRVGNMTSMKDANNNTTNYVYDGLNRQSQIINALAQTTTTTYDLVGNVKTVTDPTGHVMTYGYDRNNRRTTTSDERGLIQTILYNQVGLAKTVTNAIGNTTTNTYDNRNRLTFVADQFGAVSQTRYYDNSTILATIDAEGHRTDYQYDPNNQRINTIDPLGNPTLTEYDEVGNILAITDVEGRTTTYEYDDSNRHTKTIDPLAHTTRTAYDKVGNTITSTDAQGRITRSTYDPLNRLKTLTQASGTTDTTTTTNTYDAVGNLIATTDGRNHTTTYTPDALNRRILTTDTYLDTTRTTYYDTPALIAAAIGILAPAVISTINIGKIIATTDANNRTTFSVYDIAGRLTDTYDGSGHRTSRQTYYKDDRIKTSVDTHNQTTTYTYNDSLRATIILNPLGVTTTKKYDKVTNLIQTSDTESRTTQYEYDQLNRQTQIVDAEGGRTNYTYYNDGKTKTITDAAFNTTSYIYDSANRLTKETSPQGIRTYTYDNVDNRTSTKDRNGRTTDYTYDNLNRLKTERWVSNSQLFTYTYDKNSNLTSADNGTLHYDYTYDDTDLLIREDRISAATPTVSFKYDYDPIGNPIRTDELIGGTITATTIYRYDDPRNLNTEITQTGVGLAAKRIKLTYDSEGQNTKIERYLGSATPVLTTTNAYDIYGRLTGINQKNSSGVTIADSTYGFDNLSRLISETKDSVNRVIAYDKIDQVKAVTGSNSEAYNYDLNGNRTNVGYATGINNQLNSDGTYNYQYDAEGNRIQRTKIADNIVDNYTWDHRNRLATVISKNAAGIVTQTVVYEYDIDDQRISTSTTLGASGITTVEKYYLDGNQIAFVTDAAGNQLFHYLYGLNVDAVMAQDSPTGMVWSLADRLGTVDTLADASGTVIDKRTFDSFGRLLSETNPSVKFRYGYTGREQDKDTGLDYYRARYYDPANGRFISVDPAGFGAGDTNLYRYVGNRSTMYTDPSGEFGLPSWSDITQGASNLFNRASQGLQDHAYNQLVYVDKYIAGFANLATGGYTTQLRNEVYGDKVAGQHEGWLYNLGQVAGFGVTAALSFLAPGALSGQISTAERVAQGYVVAQTGMGAYNTTTKIKDGQLDWSSPWSYLELATSYAPAFGAATKQFGKIGAVENAWNGISQKASGYLNKATSVAGDIWGNVTQQGSNWLNKATSVVDDIWQNAFNPRLVLKEGGNDVNKLLYGARVGENLPGLQGVKISSRPTTSELELLTAKHNVEFAVMYKYGSGKNGGGGQYILYSGTINQVRLPVRKDMMLIYHTHPSGTAVASEADQEFMRLLKKFGSPQRSSQIVPVDKPTFRYDSENPNEYRLKS